MNEAELRERLLREGFSIINRYDDPAGAFFLDHNHPGDQLLIVLSGLISIEMNGKTTILKSGDEMYFPAGVMHSARVGTHGCVYLDGEKPVAH